jgi:hypothetical protein
VTDSKTAAATATAATLPATAPVPKPPLVGGGKIAAIVPQDFESAYRLANVVVSSGMAPKSLDTVEKATVAILHGLEVGFTPMAALQSIAVVNGMPTIFGDGMIALVRASGLLEDIIETVEDDKDGPTIAVCKVKRAGQPSWTVQAFTRPQAMKAGLWRKQGPWTQYPQRMMQMRARSWALRDAFPDVLRGLGSAEEMSDMVDVTASGSATTAPPEPRRSDYVHAEAAADPTAKSDPPHNEETGEIKEPAGKGDAETANPWLAEGTGQEALTKAIIVLIGKAKTEADLEAIDKANGARVAKFTQANRAAIANVRDDKLEDIRGAA